MSILKEFLRAMILSCFFASDIFSGQARFLKARPDFIILDLLLRSPARDHFHQLA